MWLKKSCHTSMSAEKDAPCRGREWTWEDVLREHREWCNIHVTCIVCNMQRCQSVAAAIAEEREQNLLWAMAKLKLEAVTAAEHEADIHDRC